VEIAIAFSRDDEALDRFAVLSDMFLHPTHVAEYLPDHGVGRFLSLEFDHQPPLFSFVSGEQVNAPG
jgi:hypothetical protein